MATENFLEAIENSNKGEGCPVHDQWAAEGDCTCQTEPVKLEELQMQDVIVADRVANQITKIVGLELQKMQDKGEWRPEQILMGFFSALLSLNDIMPEDGKPKILSDLMDLAGRNLEAIGFLLLKIKQGKLDLPQGKKLSN